MKLIVKALRRLDISLYQSFLLIRRILLSGLVTVKSLYYWSRATFNKLGAIVYTTDSSYGKPSSDITKQGGHQASMGKEGEG